MQVFFTNLENKIRKYKTRYKKDNLIIKIKIIFWILKQCFILKKININIKKHTNSDTLFFTIKLGGGVGDIILGMHYVQSLHKFCSCKAVFDIISDKNEEVLKSLTLGHSYVREVFYSKNITLKKISQSDVFIDIVRFPKVIFFNETKVKKLSQKIFDLIKKYNEFNENYFYFSDSAIEPLRIIWSLNNGHVRKTQTDIFHFLGMNKKTRFLLKMSPEAYSIIDKYNLNQNHFITIQRGVDSAYKKKENVRLWPYEYYNELLKMIKNKFPYIKIVQIGKKDPDNKLEYIDINLQGKTSFEELKVLLKQSVLHIDGENGMVHLNHALNGHSAVFFAQTSLEFLSYSENINMKSLKNCPHWCEWVTPDWQEKCIRGYKKPPCIYDLKPKYCFKKISCFLEKKLQQNFTLIETQENSSGKTILKKEDIKNYIPIFQENEELYADILNLPFEDNSLDMIVWNEEGKILLLENYIFKEAIRVLKLEGYFEFNGKRYKKVFKPA